MIILILKNRAQIKVLVFDYTGSQVVHLNFDCMIQEMAV